MERTLDEWLDYQLRTHPQQIAMGLERVREVAIRMRLGRAGRHVVTVAGTNGKGSTVAFVEAIARAAGLRVGAFTSPHLLRYNERIRLCGDDDTLLVVAHDAVNRVLLCRVLGLPLSRLWAFRQAPTTINLLEGPDVEHLELVRLNDCQHHTPFFGEAVHRAL